MSVVIIVDGEKHPYERERYFSYRDYANNVEVREMLSNNLNIEGSFKATFRGSNNAFYRNREPDLDNILLYNMGITRAYDSFVLEKDIGPQYENVEYFYIVRENVSTEDYDDSSAYSLDTGYLELTDNREVYNYYNSFREWLSRQSEFDMERYKKLFNGKRLELVIKYKGHYQISEYPFIKHAVDGIVSALQRNNRNKKNVNPQSPAMCVLEGNEAITASGRWNPQDDLLDKIIVIKEEANNDNFIHIRIRSIGN